MLTGTTLGELFLCKGTVHSAVASHILKLHPAASCIARACGMTNNAKHLGSTQHPSNLYQNGCVVAVLPM